MPKVAAKVVKTIYLFLTLLFLYKAALSQTLPFRNYTDKDGLPESFVMSLCQDSKGFLWLGSRLGLSRFDGKEFKNFSKESGGTAAGEGLLNNKIRTIREDRRGNLWIGTFGGGVCRYSRGKFKNYTTAQGLADNTVRAIAEDKKGLLWFGTINGLSRFDGKEFLNYTAAEGLRSKYIYDMAFDRDGKLWLATKEGAAYLWNNQFTFFTRADGLANNEVTTVLPDSKGKVWFGTKNGGISCFQDKRFISYTAKNGLSDNNISTIIEDHAGNIWIGTWNGVTLYSGGRFSTYRTENGLSDNFIYSLLQDREGNIWIGSSGGASCLNSVNIENFSRENAKIKNVVLDIIEDKKGRFWIGTSDGLSRYSNGKFERFTKENGLINNNVNGLLEDRLGNIWISTVEGLCVYSSGAFTDYYTVKDGLSSNVLFALVQDRNGIIWIGSKEGLNLYEKGNFSGPPFKMKPSRVIKLLEDSKMNLWFTSNDHLFKYSIPKGKLNDFSRQEGLSNNAITYIFEDSSGRIWFATSGGLSSYRNGNFTNYSVSDGLPDNKCRFLLETDDGNLWIGTAKGLVCFNGTFFKTYSKLNHSLPTNVWITGIKTGSTLWLGSAHGITRLKLPFKINRVPPPIHITSVKILEKEVPLTGSYQLEYEQNHLRIGFSGICFSAPGSVRYKSKLEGIDKDWQETGDPSLFYPYLPPGAYKFKVKCINNDGIESEQPAQLSLRIFPPFWQTWWFLFLAGSTAVALPLALVLWRFQRTKARDEIRHHKAEVEAKNRQLMMAQRMELMGTLASGAVHDMKNLLALIMVYSEIVGLQFQPDDENYQHIELIKDTANTAVQMSKQILTLSSHQEELPGAIELGELMDDIINTLRLILPPKIHIKWQRPAEPVRFEIHMARFQQLVINLCLNATDAMPGGGQLTTSLSHTPGGVIMVIEDSGEGIEPEHLEKIFDPMFSTKTDGKGTGLGLFVVKQIVEQHDGTIDVKSKPGKGTSFTINMSAR
ncbi:MAG: hypothetical protein GY757_40440 [bacterium]|nr:hypothetical protein [bacterium]